jgi:hypothetical protein
MQVYKLAEEIGVSHQIITKTLEAWGVPVGNHMSKVPEKLEDQIRRAFAKPDNPPAQAEIRQDSATPVKKSTRPWEQKGWVPDVFRLEKKHEGFHPRFVTEEKVDARLDEGWQMAEIKDYVDNPEVIKRQGVVEEGKDGTRMKRKGMRLMELPDELMEGKRNWLKHKVERQTVDAHRRDLLRRTKQIGQKLGEEGLVKFLDE